MQTVGRIGQLIEDIYDGYPQDIEGCLGNDEKYYVVQTRP